MLGALMFLLVIVVVIGAVVLLIFFGQLLFGILVALLGIALIVGGIALIAESKDGGAGVVGMPMIIIGGVGCWFAWHLITEWYSQFRS